MAEPSTREWRDLHETFKDYCQAKPWQWLDNDDLVVVEHPSKEYKGYCAAMGSAGIEYGLAVYIGDEGLAGYLSLMTGEIDPEFPDSIDSMRSLAALLADRANLDNRDRAIIRDLGLKYRGRGRWPLFRSAVPGYVPWLLNSDEAVFLTMALRNIMDVAARMSKGELDLYSEDEPSLVLTLVFRDGEWRDQREILKPPRLPAAPPGYPDSERLERMARADVNRTGIWELSKFYLDTAFQGNKGDTPYLPMIVLVVHRESSFILGTSMLGESPSALEQQEILVDTLETAPGLPSEIVVDSTSTAQLVESITAALDIRLSVGATPGLDEVKASLMGFIGNLP